MVYEYLNDEEQALDSFCDALLVEEENPELNKWKIITCLRKSWLRRYFTRASYLETSPQGKEYFSTQER